MGLNLQLHRNAVGLQMQISISMTGPPDTVQTVIDLSPMLYEAGGNIDPDQDPLHTPDQVPLLIQLAMYLSARQLQSNLMLNYLS